MKSIITLVIGMAAAGGGVYLGQTMKTQTAEPEIVHANGEGEAKAKKDDAHGKKDKKGKKDKGSKSHGGENPNYLRFKRQFVVPVVGEQGVEALVILNIALELDDGMSEELFQHEPKFRDAFIRELLALSDSGLFEEKLTSTQSYETLRETLLAATKSVRQDGVKDVLILDLARQDR